MPNALAKLLDSVCARVRRLPKDAEIRLRPPAKEEAKKRLAQAVFGKDKLPEPLATWFAAHDGVTPDSDGLDPDEAFGAWLSAAEALRAWRFLKSPKEDILQPWSEDWLPISENGGGDYQVLVLRGKDAGKILVYYHDDKRRPREAPSLEAFVKRADKSLAALEKSLKRKESGAKVQYEGAKWQENAPAPRQSALEAAPIGTAYHRRSLPYRSYWYRVFVKMAKGAWIEGRARGVARDADRDVSKAFADLQKTFAEQRQGEWKLSDAEVATILSNARVFPEGVDALKGKSARKDPYFIRRRAQLTVE